MAFSGSCHCGRVNFTVDSDAPTEAMSCNCSYCRRKGMLLAFFPTSLVQIEGRDALKMYKFNKHVIDHLFCETCGTQPIAEAQGTGNVLMNAVNLRCVPGIDLESLTIHRVDGASK